ncbi:MAG: enoyl-CoA hydratase/isomerase family protein [Solirubrobacterales bacterium]|jgi:enoyl-CoA hydratase/carnithine racemase|nr:enoyl-CoA hydratase/isomerase family protein [Solirubrobacterales bacterium]
MTGAGSTVSFAREGSLGIVTLKNPPMNLIGEALIADLIQAISDVEESAGLRAVLLSAEGDVFSAGADVTLFSGLGAEQMRPLVDSFLRLGARIEALPFPTIAAVHGTCMAGGLELALFCDLIWAAEGTMLGLPETTLGIVPLAGGVERIAARAGLGRARTIALAGGLHTAEDFAAWGVVDRVLPAADLHDKAQRFAVRLSDGPTLAYAAVKELTRAYTQAGVAAADALLLDSAVGLFDTADARNGIQGYLDSGPGHTRFDGI